MALNHKIFLMKILITQINLWIKLSFLREAMTLYRYVLQNLLLYNFNAYLSINKSLNNSAWYVANYILLQLVMAQTCLTKPGFLHVGANNL